MSKLEAVVITYNSEKDIGACLDSLLNAGMTVLVVDNRSSDGTLALLRSSYPAVEMIANEENLGYSRAVNLGLRKTNSEFVLISNADVVYSPGSLEELTSYLQMNPLVGVVGPQLVFPDGGWQRSYDDVPSVKNAIRKLLGVSQVRRLFCRVLWPMRLDRAPREVPYVDGAAMVVRRRAFNQITGFDEAIHFYGEDADFCSRLRDHGWSTAFDPDSIVIHVRGGSSTRVEGAWESYIRRYVDSVAYVVAKASGARRALLFARLEELHARKMIVLYRLLRRLRPQKRETMGRRIKIMSTIRSTWHDKSRFLAAPRN